MAPFTKPKEVSRMRMLGTITRDEFDLLNNMWARGLNAVVNSEDIEFHNGHPDPVAVVDRSTQIAKLYPDRCGGNDENYFLGIAGHADRRTPYSVEYQS